MLIRMRRHTAVGLCVLLCSAFFTQRAVAAESGAPIESVVVTATRSERPLADVPASVSVIGSRTIDDTPGQALDDVLRRSPSVDLPNATSYQVHPTANNISMRGLGGIRALVLLDGVPINDPFFGYLQWSRVPLEFIDQVEIVRGGAATLWGNYAMGGVINIRTKEPMRDELTLQGGGGSYGTYRANATGSYVVSDAARFGIVAGRHHTDGFMQIAPELRGSINVPTAFTSNNAAFRGSVDVNPTLNASTRVDYVDNEQTLQTRLSHNAQHTLNYAGTLAQALDKDANMTLTIFGSDSTFTTDNTGGLEGMAENQAEFLQNVHRTPVKDFGASLVLAQSLSWGWLRSYSIGVDNHRIAGEDVADIYDETGTRLRTDIGRGKQRFWGGFAQASVHPSEPIEILASVRYQSFHNFDAFDGTPGGVGHAPDSSENSIDPRVSVRYAASESVALRAAYYTAFRAPTLDNLYRAFAVPFGIFYANPELVPEHLKGGEVGLDVHTQRLRTQLTWYTNTIDDLITSRNLDADELPSGFFFGSRNINAGKARSRGMELETELQITQQWSTHASYTYADSEIIASTLDPASVGRQVGGVPRNRASVGVVYKSANGWRVAPQFRWVQSSFADNDHTLPVDAQRIVDLAVSYPFSQLLEAFLQIENLFDQRYIADNGGFNPPLRGTPLSAFFGVRLHLR